MKYVTLTVGIEVDDNANPADVQAMAHRGLTETFSTRHVDVFVGSSREHASVLSFDHRYLIPNSSVPAWLDPQAMDFRIKFMQEELNEFRDAYVERDMKTAFDSLADLAWVTHGTGTMMGMPWGVIWSEVHRANMEKERATGADDPRSKRKSALDVVKPHGWKEADHSLAVGPGPWPTLDTTLCAIRLVKELDAGNKPTNKFSPTDADSCYAPMKATKAAQQVMGSGLSGGRGD